MYMRLIILLFLLLLCACASIAPSPESAPSPIPKVRDNHSHSLYLFSRARIAAHEGDYLAVLNLLREVIVFELDSAIMHGEVVDIKLKIGQILEVFEYINKVIALDFDYRSPYVLVGIVMSS